MCCYVHPYESDELMSPNAEDNNPITSQQGNQVPHFGVNTVFPPIAGQCNVALPEKVGEPVKNPLAVVPQLNSKPQEKMLDGRTYLAHLPQHMNKQVVGVGHPNKVRKGILPHQIILTVMSYLDPSSLLRLRGLCRMYNEVFLMHAVQQTFALSCPRSPLEPVVGVYTITEVVHRRKTTLRFREQAWSSWLATYFMARLKKTKDERVMQRVMHDGQSQRVQLRWARDSCILAVDHLLAHLTDCRRAKFNIRRNWFNVTSVRCKMGRGVPPVFLPDGTLCVNDPPERIVFYAQQSLGARPGAACRSHLNGTPQTYMNSPSGVWTELERLSFSAPVTHMFYDPHVNALHTSLADGRCKLWRVRSFAVDESSQRLESGVEHEPPPPLRSWHKKRWMCTKVTTRVEAVGSYRLAGDTLEEFSASSCEGISLQDYEWTEAEMCSKVRSVNKCRSVDTSRFIVVRHERDVSSSYLPRTASADMNLRKEDVLTLRYLQRLLSHPRRDAHGDPSYANWGDASHFDRESNSSLDISAISFNAINIEEPDHGASAGLSDRNGSRNPLTRPHETTEPPRSRRGRMGSNVTEILITSQGREKREGIAPILANGTNEYDFARNVDVKRYVFGVYNEQARLMCACTATQEALVYLLTTSSTKTLGIHHAGNTCDVYILSAPRFVRCEFSLSDEVYEEADAFIVCLSQRSILICQQKIFRRLEKIDAFYQHPVSKQCGAGGSNLSRTQRSANGTWYFLKGYSYMSPSSVLRPVVEISVPLLQCFVRPRPMIAKYMELMENRGTDWQAEQQPHQSSSWYSQREGHPFFRRPFMLYLSKLTAFLVALFDYTEEERQQFALDDVHYFQGLSLFEGAPATALHPSAIALSPSHAFFVLGMENGSILLVSPYCRNETRKQMSQGGGAKAHGKKCTADQLPGSKIAFSCEGAVGKGREASRFVWDCSEDEDELIGDDSLGDIDYPSSVCSPRSHGRSLPAPQNHFYRSTELSTAEQAQTQRQRSIRLFTAEKLFGSGFLEDDYIRTLQRGAASILGSMKSFDDEHDVMRSNSSMPLHAVWIHSPNDVCCFSRKASVWTMHLDDWKLTTLNKAYEISIYDMTLRPNTSKTGGKAGFAFAPLMTLSAYKSHPFLGIPHRISEDFICRRVRELMRKETEKPATGKEIVWHNGILVVCGLSRGERLPIFDFSPKFRDSNTKDETNMAPAAYSTSKAEYREKQFSSAQMMLPISGGKRGKRVSFPRHYQLLLRDELTFLFMAALWPVALLFASAGIFAYLLHLDRLVNCATWLPAAIYSPCALCVIARNIVLHDRYYCDRSGAPYVIRFARDVLLYVVTPISITMMHGVLDCCGSWAVVTSPLCIAIAMTSLPEICVILSQRRQSVSAFMAYMPLGDILMQLLLILFIQLLAAFFDGPSAGDRTRPKFSLAIPFATGLPLLYIPIKNFWDKLQNERKLSALVAVLHVAVIVAVSTQFYTEFKEYYLRVSPKGGDTRVTLTRTLLALPALLLLDAVRCIYRICGFIKCGG
ncbi:hypothetical protein TRVL_04654 [Trypanosoma vivax]|nr:hypothetical protein TRVL_04654 [Trypanosoma vivax]